MMDGMSVTACFTVLGCQTRAWADIAANSGGVTGDGGRREAGEVGEGHLGDGLAEAVDGGAPARPEHDGDVVAVHAGGRAECGRGLVGQTVWIPGHRPNRTVFGPAFEWNLLLNPA